MLLLLPRRRYDRTLSHAPTHRKTELGVILCFLMCDEYTRYISTLIGKVNTFYSAFLNGLWYHVVIKKKEDIQKVT